MTSPVVLITGSLTGIGRASAFALAREGARLVVSGRHEEPGHAQRRNRDRPDANGDDRDQDEQHEQRDQDRRERRPWQGQAHRGAWNASKLAASCSTASTTCCDTAR